MIRGNKLSNYIERVTETQKPITADIFLTDFCNNKCSYCRYTHSAKEGNSISLEDFKWYIQKLMSLGVKGFILTGGGEPTVNPDFDKICEWLERNNIPYGINTNMNILKKVKPNFLKVSLDTGYKETYKLMRGVDAFDKVLKNLKEYIDWIQQTGAKTKIGVQCVTTSVEQVQSFYNAVRNLDVNYIQFRPVETRERNIDYTDILDKVRKLEKEDCRVSISYKYDLVDYRPAKCFANWSVVTVNTRGEVLYCCHRPDAIIGRVEDADILEKLKDYKPNMAECESPCRLSGANKYLDDLQVERDIYFV